MATEMLRPSDILYTQRSINNHFDSKSGFADKKIGETLDDIYYGRTSIEEIPRISVVYREDEWFSIDNRRLWVFKHLESLGQCGVIPVNVVNSIPPKKQTSKTAGRSVQVRGDPGGYWHRQADLHDGVDYFSENRDFGNDRQHYGNTNSMNSHLEESSESSLGSTIAKGALIGGAALACHFLFNRYKNKD